MSGFPVNTLAQANEYRKQYMATLALQAQNDAYNLRANQVYRQTGQPSRPLDMRTTTEKLADIEQLRVEVLNELTAITDKQMAIDTVTNLSADELQFVAQQIDNIVSEIKPKFQRGIPSQALLTYIRALRQKDLAINGVSFPAQEATAQSILNAIQNGRAVGAPLPPFAPAVPAPAPAPRMNPALLNQLQGTIAPLAPAPAPAPSQRPRMDPTLLNQLQGQLTNLKPPAPAPPAPPSLLNQLQNQLNNLRPTSAPPSVTGTMPENPAGRKLSDFEIAIRDRARQLGISAEDLDTQAEAIAREEANRQAVNKPTIKKQSFENMGEFNKLSWQKIRAWYDDWNIILPEIAGLVPVELTNTRGADAGRLKYTPVGGVANGRLLLTPAAERFLELKSNANPRVEGLGFQRSQIYRGLEPKSRFPTGREILGYGLGARKVTIDMSKGIQNTAPQYVPFGKFIINPNKLSRGICEVRSLSGGKLGKYPDKQLSPSLTKIMRRILDNRMPDEYDYNEMDMNDQNFLYDLSRDAKINDRLNIPTPKLCKDGEEQNRFEILKGEIQAGNDNREMVKEFKHLLVRFSNDGRIKKNEAREILLDLTSLGY